jgi:hypothetical protein
LQAGQRVAASPSATADWQMLQNAGAAAGALSGRDAGAGTQPPRFW